MKYTFNISLFRVRHTISKQSTDVIEIEREGERRKRKEGRESRQVGKMGERWLKKREGEGEKEMKKRLKKTFYHL